MEVIVKDLVKAYKIGKVEVQALRSLSLEVEKGDIISIIGSSGSGKTTLFRILSTLIPIQSGRVTISGIDLSKNPVVRIHLFTNHRRDITRSQGC